MQKNITTKTITVLQRKYLPTLHPRFKADLQVESGTGVSPSSLGGLIFSSDIIVIGYFEGILQHRHCPRNSYGPIQCTIYDFHIESYLKSENGESSEYIKTFHLGGPLQWQDRETKQRGSGYKISGNPFPILKNRYILFLKDPKERNRFMAMKGFTEYTQNGVKGEYQYADEYNYTYPEYGMVLLLEKKAFAGQIVDAPKAHWDLGALLNHEPGSPSRLQVTNVSEAEAIENIKKIIATQPPKHIIERTDNK